MNVKLGDCKHRGNSLEPRKERVKDLKGNFHIAHGFQKPEFWGLTIMLKFYEPKYM